MRFFVSHIFDGVIMDGHHYDTIEDEKNNKSHLLVLGNTKTYGRY